MGGNVPSNYFVNLYRQNPDPWNFATSPYERSKYAATLAALPIRRYKDGCELGCSIGVFTRMLAARCDRLVACDISPDAIESARRRCDPLQHIDFRPIDLSKNYPEGRFDLTTVCELGYYFPLDEFERLRENVVAHSVVGASIVLVHWTPHVTGHTMSAHAVHEAFRDDPRLRHIRGYDAQTYRLDVLVRGERS